ncbi:MAG: RloB family protein [Candidatus Nomurabacteria bacterium]|jgi:hypothetical protein|nr:RloB family protein [Candidatus Nomurabacteria bacterium]
MPVVPQMILICCEGKETEKLYFGILQRMFKVANISIKTFPQVGQHYQLIDECVKKKQEIALAEGFSLDDVEVWAVCDMDAFADNFLKLKAYADDGGVNLAFSSPQFENYILQHFGSPNNSKSRRGVVEREITDILLSKGAGMAYNKADLSWLEDMIDQKPRIVSEAIRHADTYSNHAKQPFFTVQRLTERILFFRTK